MKTLHSGLLLPMIYFEWLSADINQMQLESLE